MQETFAEVIQASMDLITEAVADRRPKGTHPPYRQSARLKLTGRPMRRTLSEGASQEWPLWAISITS